MTTVHHVRGRAEDRDRVGHERQRRICLRLTAGGIERHVLQQVAHADGRDHDRHTRRAAKRLIGRALDDEAEQHRQHEHERNGHIHRQRRAHEHHHQACTHEHVAVCEVNQAQDAVDHRVADGDERILAADRNIRLR